jgi:hypothetical protein
VSAFNKKRPLGVSHCMIPVNTTGLSDVQARFSDNHLYTIVTGRKGNVMFKSIHRPPVHIYLKDRPRSTC